VEGLKAQASNPTADTPSILQLQSTWPQLKSDADRRLAAWQQIPVPEAPKPGDASATVVNDPRLQWILVSSLGYALLMVALLAVSGVSYHRHHLLTGQSNQSDDEEEADEFPASELADVLESRGAAPAHGGEESADDLWAVASPAASASKACDGMIEIEKALSDRRRSIRCGRAINQRASRCAGKDS